MHTLLIHQAFVSPAEAGGTRHFELGRSVTAAGHQFTIVAANLSYLTGQRVVQTEAWLTEQKMDGLSVLRAYTYPSLHRSFAWRVVSFLSFMATAVAAALRAGPVDVVMGTTPPIFQAVSAWLVAALRRRPLLLEVRDLWPEFAIALGVLKNPLLIAGARALEGFLYRQARHILVNSPAYRDYLLRRGIPADKISLIPNGVDSSMFDPAQQGEAFRRELDLGDAFVVTYAGALGMANDLGTVLQAADRLRAEPGLVFLLVGDGKERANLEAEARRLGLPNVRFTGARPKDEIPTILAASDACLAILKDIPEFRTTYPNKVFDYMAAGRPTLLAIVGVIREVMEAARGGIIVPPGDAAALADAVLTLKRAPDRARALGLAARAYVVQYFDRRDQAQSFLALLQKLAART